MRLIVSDLIGGFDVYPPTVDASGTDTLEILPFIYHFHDRNSALIPYLTEPQRISAPAPSRRLDLYLLHLLPGPIGSKEYMQVHG